MVGAAAAVNPTLEAALTWKKRGAAPIAVGYRSKQPVGAQWTKQRHTAEAVAEIFNGTPLNIGVLWGTPSGGLVDVDLDWPEACQIAAALLPRTAVYGRAGNRGSHHLLRVSGAVTRKWTVPAALVPDGHKDVVLELRADGTQSVVPPSTHPSGEQYEWDLERKPAALDHAALLRRLNLVASGAVLVSRWRHGIRHPLALALSGAMLSSGYSVDEARDFIVAVATAAGDDEIHDRKLAVKSSQKALEAGTPATGIPKLAELIGEDAVAVLKRWLGLGSALPAGWLSSDVPAPLSSAAEGERLVVLDAATIKEEPIRWLWPNRIARGKLNIVAGEPGLSKSVLSCTIAAIVTRGRAWPLDGTQAERGDVLILNVEDDPADTIVPRLRAADADLSRVQIIEGVRAADGKTRHMTLADVAQLDAHLEKHPGRYALLICDPIGALMSGRDTHRDADVRALLAPMALLAMKYNLAVLLIGHLNKGIGMAALHRVIGSIAFVAAARMMHFLTADPDDTTRLLLVPGKTNIAPMGLAGLSYTLESADLGSGIVAPRIRWHDVPEMRSANELLRPRPEHEGDAQLSAEEWLREQLAEGPIAVQAIRTNAETGIEASWATIRRAALALRVVGKGEKRQRTWELPAEAKERKSKSSKDHVPDREPLLSERGEAIAKDQEPDTRAVELMSVCTLATEQRSKSSKDQESGSEPLSSSGKKLHPCTDCSRLRNNQFCTHFQRVMPEPAAPNACIRFEAKEPLTPWG